MKTILAAVTAGVLFAHMASAVPQTVGTGFLGAAGVSFERYVASPEPWVPDAVLKGPWLRRGTQSEDAGVPVMFELGVKTTVFGLPAARISVERKEGRVLRFVVQFDENVLKNAKLRRVALLDQVVANVTALAGEPKSVSPGGEKTFRHEASLITVRKGDRNGVVVEFTPAR